MSAAPTIRVVVTGCGAVTALGADAGATWDGLARGRSGVRRITRFDASGLPSQIAGEAVPVKTQHVAGAPPAEELSVIGRMAIVAAAEALAGARLAAPACSAHAMGLSFAAGSGDFAHEEIAPAIAAGAGESGFNHAAMRQALRRSARPHLALRTHTGTTLAQLARTFGLTGPQFAPLTACAAGTQAIGDAARAIRAGRMTHCLAGGSDSRLFPIGILGHSLLGALCTDSNADPERGSRPFDRSRAGFVAAEGAGALVLESLDSARHRGAPILAEILGFGCTSDAYRATDPHPDGRGAAAAISAALTDAAVSPDALDYVNAHGTSTQANDLAESRALHLALGAAASSVPVGSFKSMLGHATAAAGAIELVGTIHALREQLLPPTINVGDLDPEIRLNVITEPFRAPGASIALSNSFGFGGQNASVVIRGWAGR